jgi:hypothetical protein
MNFQPTKLRKKYVTSKFTWKVELFELNLQRTNTNIMSLPDENILLKPSDRLTRRGRVVKFLIHLICLGMLFVLPEILNSTGKQQFSTVPMLRLGIYLKALVFIAVFYINYYYIIGKSFDRRLFILRMIGYNLIVIVGALMLFWLINAWMQPYWDEAWRMHRDMGGPGGPGGPPEPRPHHHPDGWLYWVNFFARDFVMLVLTTGLSIALKLSDIWLKISRRSEQLIAARRQEELQNLKSQLNPHFLFNTLNSIYALTAVSPEKAQEAIHELSGLLRYVLYDNSDEVELKREMRFIENYVKLMALRLPASATVECNIDPNQGGENYIAPLLFVPLVENAFKHGNTGRPDMKIEISITVNDGKVVCRTVNGKSHQPSTTVAPGEEKSGGIGLTNLRRRLQLIYGDPDLLKISSDDDIFIAELTIPVHNIKH